jgi:hypothetical protein
VRNKIDHLNIRDSPTRDTDIRDPNTDIPRSVITTSINSVYGDNVQNGICAEDDNEHSNIDDNDDHDINIHGANIRDTNIRTYPGANTEKDYFSDSNNDNDSMAYTLDTDIRVPGDPGGPDTGSVSDGSYSTLGMKKIKDALEEAQVFIYIYI